MSKDNGGTAFPITVRKREKFCDEAGYGRTREVQGLEGGMTLRDHFAAMHMQAITSTAFYAEGNLMPYEVAQHSYEMADAMLAERSKP